MDSKNSKLEKIFKGCEGGDPSRFIHRTVAAAAVIVSAAPVGYDAILLTSAEVLMIVQIAKHFGVKMDRTGAEAFLKSSFALGVGYKTGIALLEAANAAGLAAFGIKFGVASAVIEGVGWTTLKMFEGSKLASGLSNAMNIVGAANAIGTLSSALPDSLALSLSEIEARQLETAEAKVQELIAAGAPESDIQSALHFLDAIKCYYDFPCPY